MEESVSTENVHLNTGEEKQKRGIKSLYDCLQKIKDKEDCYRKEKGKKTEADEKIGEGKTEQNKQPSFADKLLEALTKNDELKVWELVENNPDIIKTKTLKSLSKVCKRNKESRCCCNCNFDCNTVLRCGCICSRNRKDSCAIEQQNNNHQGAGNKEQDNEQQNDKEKLKWIKILSNPLFITVEWLWRRNADFKCEPGKESKNVDIIQAALDDACTVEEMAWYEHHYSRDEYKSAVKAIDEFAVDVMEGTPSTENYDVKIMDIEGDGCLLTKGPENFIQSLSLVKIAANKGRKKFVAGPRSQIILNKIIYYKWEGWQNESTLKKIFWFFFQYCVLIPITILIYVPYRVCRKLRSKISNDGTGKNDTLPHKSSKARSGWRIESLYEHPYSKLINHSMSYTVFVSLLIASTFGFEHDYRTSTTGFSRIDYAVLGFVVGLLFQEFWEAFKQGFCLYFSKWWNIVDTVTITFFLAAYAIWFIAWGSYGEWQPRRIPFIVADVLYAGATVMAFFHLTHFFQVSSILGPLQLSLYRMLKDVLKFLLIFLMLYIAFATGVVKVYSYYVASQIKLRDQDNSHDYQDYHPYAKHENTLIGLVWLLIGYVEEDKIVVDDPAFTLTSIFGRIALVAYIVCTAIVALNMLIAMMNNSFERVMNDTDRDVEWKFSRAQMWLEWIDKGNAIPVPFNIIYYTFYIVSFVLIVLPCWIFKRCKNKKWPCCETVQSSQECSSVRTGVEQKEMSGSGDQLHTGSVNQLVRRDVMQGSGDQTSNHCCTWWCFSNRWTCHCRPAVKADDAAKKERMDAMEYLVWRYVNDHYLVGFEGKFNSQMSTMESQTDAATGQGEITA